MTTYLPTVCCRNGQLIDERMSEQLTSDYGNDFSMPEAYVAVVSGVVR